MKRRSLNDPFEGPLLAGSSYKQLQNATFPFYPQSGYTPGANFNAAYSSNRPKADLRGRRFGRPAPTFLVSGLELKSVRKEAKIAAGGPGCIDRPAEAGLHGWRL